MEEFQGASGTSTKLNHESKSVRSADYDLAPSLLAAREKCVHFHGQLLSRPPCLPSKDFPFICDTWKKVTEADWVWLWLYNEITSQWELAAHDSSFSVSGNAYGSLLSLHSRSVAEYASSIERPVIVDDLVGWSRTLHGTKYRVANAKRIKQLGARCFRTIPLLSPSPSAEDGGTESVQRAVITTYFKHSSPAVDFQDDSLLLMGKLSAAQISRSHASENNAILDRLNELAEKHLTSVHRQHGVARQKYLKALCDLVQKRLNVRAVSLFYQVPFESQVECLATTGLVDSKTSLRAAQDQLSNYVYESNEGLTGECFFEGVPHIRLRNARDGHTPKYVEVHQGKVLRNRGSCFCPIPRAKFEKANASLPKAHGVIRCADPYSALLKSPAKSFSPTALQKLNFITRQIAPVLHTFATRIQREYTITITKHDLDTPLNMIRDVSDDIATYVGRSQTVKWHDLMNLKTSAAFAQNLVDQLDPDPFEIPALDIEAVLLEADIVARLKHMLDHFAQRSNEITLRYSMFVSDEERVPAMYLDRAVIERAFWNLLINAIKYSPKKSQVSVQASMDDRGGINIDISNDGVGVKYSERAKIFTPRYRAKSVRDKVQGLGVGLPIAKRALEKYRGRVVLLRRSNPTIFRMHFPRHLQDPTWHR